MNGAGVFRSVGRIAIAGVMMSGVLQACPVCFQADDGVAAAGVARAVLVLAGVTVGVLVPCVAFAVRLARRDAALARDRHEHALQ